MTRTGGGDWPGPRATGCGEEGSQEFEDVAAEARTEADAAAAVAGDLARLTPLSQSQIEQLFPTIQDKESLARLLAVVNSAESEDRKLSEFRANGDEFSRVALRLIHFFTR